MMFWPGLLYLAGHRKLAWRSLGTVVILYSVPLLIYGPIVYREWFAALRSEHHAASPINIAIIPVLSRFGFHSIGILLASLVGCFSAWLAHKNKPDFTSVSGVGICVGILCAPLAWFHYVSFLAPFFVTRPWRLISTAAACLFLLPVSLSVAASGVPYLTAVLGMLYCFLQSGSESSPNRREETRVDHGALVRASL